jgi:hypothetical protein
VSSGGIDGDLGLLDDEGCGVQVGSDHARKAIDAAPAR